MSEQVNPARDWEWNREATAPSTARTGGLPRQVPARQKGCSFSLASRARVAVKRSQLGRRVAVNVRSWHEPPDETTGFRWRFPTRSSSHPGWSSGPPGSRCGTAHALLFWLVVCVDELSARDHSPWLTPGAGLLIVASIALLVVATGAGVSRRNTAVGGGALRGCVRSGGRARGGAHAGCVRRLFGLGRRNQGLEGARSGSPSSWTADTVFLWHGGHSAVVWRWILRVAVAHATLGLVASLRCFLIPPSAPTEETPVARSQPERDASASMHSRTFEPSARRP